MEIVKQEELDLPQQEELLREQVQIGSAEPRTLPNFLSKFRALRKIYRSPDIIRRITRESIQDAAADNIRYLELRFTPAALAQSQGYPLDEIVQDLLS